jgi:membrane-associated phospholipid phosphatase
MNSGTQRLDGNFPTAKGLARMLRRCALFASLACGTISAVPAQNSVSVQGVLDDTKLYFTAPMRWDTEDWAIFGGALIAVAGSHAFDERVRNHFASGPDDGLDGGKDKNSLRDAVPTVAIIAGTGFFAGFYRDSDGYRETVSLLEAGAFSAVTAEALGYATGRERPDATTSPNRWRAGGDSFPSLHTSTAFAVGTVFAESGNDEYRWIRRLIGYGVAGATAYVRVKENDHWVSDSLAGAALGIATARFILNREEQETDSAMQFSPIKNGWMISYSMRTH